MRPATLLLRQVHPSWVQAGRASSQVFTPTPKDRNCLSVYDGDQITAQDSWAHFTTALGCRSVGVLAVTVAECEAQGIEARSDPAPYPEHVLVDFGQRRGSEVRRIASHLRNAAEGRGWQFEADETHGTR
jgi:hypothetical protein